MIALTGSNGKTSVKTLLQSILQRAGNSYFNPGNRNNEIGLPLAVIDAPDDADFAIYEMGAGKPGDIAYLTDIAVPGCGPGEQHRAGASGAHGQPDGRRRNQGRDLFGAVRARRGRDQRRRRLRRVFRPACAPLASACCASVWRAAPTSPRAIFLPAGDGSRFVLVAPQGEIAVTLPLPGRHNVLNALAAACMALACEVALIHAIAEGLAAARPVPGRQVAHTLPNGVVLIDDSYNANPGSLAAAIDTLAAAGSEAWLVLGDMRELGDGGEALHAEAGRRAKAAGISSPVHARRAERRGRSLRSAKARAVSNRTPHWSKRCARIWSLLPPKGTSCAWELEPARRVRCLVKGSRGSAMDRIVAALLSTGEDASHAA